MYKRRLKVLNEKKHYLHCTGSRRKLKIVGKSIRSHVVVHIFVESRQHAFRDPKLVAADVASGNESSDVQNSLKLRLIHAVPQLALDQIHLR